MVKTQAGKFWRAKKTAAYRCLRHKAVNLNTWLSNTVGDLEESSKTSFAIAELSISQDTYQQLMQKLSQNKDVHNCLHIW